MTTQPREHEGRVAVVTGGRGSIGSAIALRLTAEGALVHALDVLDARQSAPNAAGQIISHKIDVSDEPSVERVFDEIGEACGKIDYLVCCAAIDSRRPFLELDFEDWRRILQVNLTGSFLCCRAAVRSMRPRKFGRIVLFASMLARTGAVEGAHFSASKGGVLGLVRALGVEAAADNIRVNAISPGVTATPQAVETRIPLGRSGSVQDMTEACMFLLGDESSFMVCQDLRVNGGASLW